ncbi:MAG: hypothetical protein K2K33_01700, partial [Muribaculaceae bacterium]|nr:hypothetical protein [Muribaculaceae bacterium]
GLHRLSEAQWRGGRDVPQAPERSPGVYNNVAPPGARVAGRQSWSYGVATKSRVGGVARVWEMGWLM